MSSLSHVKPLNHTLSSGQSNNPIDMLVLVASLRTLNVKPQILWRNGNWFTLNCCWVSSVGQAGFAAFGKGVRLISGSSYAEIEQLPLLNLEIGIPEIPWWYVTTVWPRRQRSRYNQLNLSTQRVYANIIPISTRSSLDRVNLLN